MAQPDTPRNVRRRPGWPTISLVGLLLFVVGAVGLYLGQDYLDEDDESAEAGLIFLQPAGEVGPDPFSATPLAPPPDSAVATPTVPLSAPVPIPEGTEVQTLAPAQPGLYGGSTDNTRCDTGQLKAFLAANPNKAAAFVSALNADPELGWPGGALTVADIPAYIDGLESVVLEHDTLVTNHGYRDGEPRPLQSLLQHGSAVLVDEYGVPRVRCYCGNPLIPPKPGGQEYAGEFTWEGGPGDPNGEGDDGPRVPGRSSAPLDRLPLCGSDDADFCHQGARRGRGTQTPTPNPMPDPGSAPVAPGDPSPVSSGMCTPDVASPAATLTIINQSSEPIQVVWHSFGCQPVDQTVLLPGEQDVIDSFVGHVFSAADFDGTIVDTITVPGSTDWAIG